MRRLTKELRGVHATHTAGHAHTHKAHGGTGRIGRSGTHGIALRRGDVGRSHRRIGHDGRLLQVANHLFLILGRRDGIYAKGRDLDAAPLLPLVRKFLVERIGQLPGVGGHGTVANAHLADAGESRLQGRKQLALELRVDKIARIGTLDVAADVLVEHQRIDQLVGVLAVTAHGDVDIQTDFLVDHAKRHRACGAVLVAYDLLGVEVVDALILASVPAESKAAPHLFERFLDHVAEFAREHRGLSTRVVDEFAGLGADVNHRTILDDHHALAVGHRHDRAVRDNVVLALGVGSALADTLLALGNQRIGVQSLAIKVLTPLIGQYAASRPDACLQKSHDLLLS